MDLRTVPGGELVRTLTLDGDAADRDVSSVAFSPDGKLLAASGWEPVVRVWSVADGRLLLKLVDDDHFVESVAFSPDGATLASGGRSQTIRLWEMPTGKLRRVLKQPVGHITAVAFSPDGKVLAAGGSDKTVHLWDPTRARCSLRLKATRIAYVGSVLRRRACTRVGQCRRHRAGVGLEGGPGRAPPGRTPSANRPEAPPTAAHDGDKRCETIKCRIPM